MSSQLKTISKDSLIEVGAIVSSTDPAFKDKPDTPPLQQCEFCGKMLATKGVVMPGRVIWAPFAGRCDCEKAVEKHKVDAERRRAEEEAEKKAEEEERQRKEVERLLKLSGLGKRFERRTFENVEETPQNKAAVEAARYYAEHFDEIRDLDAKNGLFFVGAPGTGKTHLAAAITNKLIQEGTSVICMTMIDLLNRIRSTYRTTGADESAVLGIYKSVSLLVIDDIGKEVPTEWALSTIYNIINGRYEAGKPIIATTNYSAEALLRRMTPKETGDDLTARATLDRIFETCKPIAMPGESWRMKGGF